MLITQAPSITSGSHQITSDMTHVIRDHPSPLSDHQRSMRSCTRRSIMLAPFTTTTTTTTSSRINSGGREAMIHPAIDTSRQGAYAQ
jgi:hypothetical protein